MLFLKISISEGETYCALAAPLDFDFFNNFISIFLETIVYNRVSVLFELSRHLTYISTAVLIHSDP